VVSFVPALLITGPLGSGKTTCAMEACSCTEASIARALADTDELDRIFPAPPDEPHKTRLTERNLASVWENLRAAGAPRLILTMVAVSQRRERQCASPRATRAPSDRIGVKGLESEWSLPDGYP
jgi:hypothetical protein